MSLREIARSLLKPTKKFTEYPKMKKEKRQNSDGEYKTPPLSTKTHVAFRPVAITWLVDDAHGIRPRAVAIVQTPKWSKSK